MKCPKCGYIGFEQPDKCRNCGYDFSLLVEPAKAVDLPLKREEPLQPPSDFDFRTGETPPPVSGPRPHNPDFDLPLFHPAAPGAIPPAPAAPSSGPTPASPPPSSGSPPAAATLSASPVAPAAAAATVPAAPPARAPESPATPTAPAPAAAVPAPAFAAAPAPAGPSASPSDAPAAVRPPAPGEPPLVRRRPVVPPPRPRPVSTSFDFFKQEPAPQPAAAAPAALTEPRSAAATPASSVARALAGLLDAIILLGLDAGVLYFTLRVCRLSSFADATALPLAPLIAFFVLLDGGYFVAFTTVGGQTIGKMATSLKVIGEDGERVAPSQAALRAVGYLASLLPAGLGFVPGLFGPSRRALHDRLANTRVVRL